MRNLEDALQIVGEKDQFATAIPGSSLTDDNSKWNWGSPPKQVDPEVVLDKAIDFLETPANKEELYKLLVAGISIEVLVEGYMIQGFQEGKFTPDVGLLLKPQLAMYIVGMAEEDRIPYRLFENKDELEKGKTSDAEFFQLMKANNPTMFSYMKEILNEGIRQGNTSDIEQETKE